MGYCFFFFFENLEILSRPFSPKPLFTPPFVEKYSIFNHPFFACGQFAALFTPPFSHATASRPCSHPLFRMRPLRGPVHTPFWHAVSALPVHTRFPTQKGSRLSREKKNNTHKLNSLCCTFCSFYSLHRRVASFLAFGCCTNPEVFHCATPRCTSFRFMCFYRILPPRHAVFS